MANFHYGFLSGTGLTVEYQLYDDTYRSHSASINTKEIDEIVGLESELTDFRGAPYHCTYTADRNCGFTICGFEKYRIQKLAILFLGYFSSINPEFGKIVPKLTNHKKDEIPFELGTSVCDTKAMNYQK